MAKLWAIKFVVQSKSKLAGQFPIDMLRYDSCYPSKDSVSVSRILNSLDINQIIEGDPEDRMITLVHNSHGDKNWTPTIARWESYGYRVVTIKQAREGY
jgi:hypothetical protein